MDLRDRVALVTGSSRGIGAGIAMHLAERGAKVAIHGRDAAALASVRAEIAALGRAVVAVTADVTRWADVENMRIQVEEALGPIDILVANAGGSFTPPALIENIPEDGWRASVDGNLTATFLTIKSILPGMKQRKRGAIVAISSSAAGSPSTRTPIPYAAAKAGIELMTKIVAAQAGPFAVRVNCVSPETILTERNQQRIPQPLQAELAAAHPLQRLGTTADVARAVGFLASDDAAWITGEVLDVTGGGMIR
jgi:3-oxoacyl-[acyl-carrier protein] reductase